MLRCAGQRILFCDADGASHFPDLALLEAELYEVQKAQMREGVKCEDVHAVVVGSRAHLVRTEAVVKVVSQNALVKIPCPLLTRPSSAVILTQFADARVPYLPLRPRHPHNVS